MFHFESRKEEKRNETKGKTARDPSEKRNPVAVSRLMEALKSWTPQPTRGGVIGEKFYFFTGIFRVSASPWRRSIFKRVEEAKVREQKLLCQKAPEQSISAK